MVDLTKAFEAARDYVVGGIDQLQAANFANRVIEELGASSEWNILDGEEAFREVLGRHTPQQVLDAIAAAEPSTAPYINLIRADDQLAATFHSQIAENPDFLTRMASLTSGEGSSFDIAGLLEKPYASQLRGQIQGPLTELMTNPDYTLEQLQTDARSGVFRAITEYAAGLEPGERLDFIRAELTSLDPAAQGIFDQLNSAPPQVQAALTNAITQNPAFAEYLVERLGSEGGSTSLAGIFENMDEQRIGALTDIMTTIANGTGYQTAEDFERLDRVIAAADARTRLEQERARLLQANADADLTDITEQISAADREILLSARAAGANVPALAMLDQQHLGRFFRDLFDPHSPDPARSALDNLAQSLQLSGADLDAFNQLMGPLAQIMNFMFEPYAQLFQNHGPGMGSGISNLMSGFERLVGGTPVVPTFQSPVIVGDMPGAATTMTSDAFNEAWDNATEKTFDAVRAELIEADPQLVEELRAISEDPSLRARFTHAVTSTATPEELEAAASAFQRQIAGGATISRAIDAMAPPSGP